MQCSLRHLNMHKLIREDELVTRRGRRVRTYAITQEGIDILRPVNLNTAGNQGLQTP